MKNFSELLATELELTVVVDGVEHTAGLRDTLDFAANATVIIDNIEILPRYSYLAADGVLTINEPFYCWYHRVSGQGWLLQPQ